MKKNWWVTIMILCLVIQTAHAQSWRYGKRGGGTDLTATIGDPPEEDVFDMAADRNSNIYVLGSVTQTGLDIDGHALTGYGRNDVAIYSLKCDGTFRWAKIIGAAQDDLPQNIATDSSGGVYAAFFSNIQYSPGAVAHISTDTTISYTHRSMFLVKYDSSGNFKWVVSPQSDTVTSPSVTLTRTIEINVDGAGNIYWLCRLPAGAYANGSFIVTSYGLYLLKYNSAGIFQSGLKMQATTDMTGAGTFGMRMQMDHRSGKIYISGEYDSGGLLTLGAHTVAHGMYIGCFNDAGSLLWEKEDTLTANVGVGFEGRPVIDRYGNIYAGGRTPGSADRFNGYEFTASSGNGAAFIAKLDSDGNNIWIHDTYTNVLAVGSGVALRNDGEVVLTGNYAGLLKWVGSSDSLYLAPNVGTHIYITRFNAETGSIIGMDTLATDHGSNAYSAATNEEGEKNSIISDGRDNVYVAGMFTNQITVNGNVIYSAGGETDLFVAKYGFDNCTCTAIPTAAFTVAVAHLVATFTYTGTAATSLSWDLGDGAVSTATNPVHTYTDSGTYTVCVTIHTACGDDIACSTVHVSRPSSVNELDLAGIVIYPDPTTGELFIAHAVPGAVIRIFNIMGQQVYSGEVAGDKQAVDISHVVSGSYILQIIDSNGSRYSKTIIKQ